VSDFLTYSNLIWGGRGGFPKNPVTQVSKKLKTVLLVLIILLINTQHAFGLPHYKPKHYKQYIVTEINNIDQAYCLTQRLRMVVIMGFPRADQNI
jgi:hypothetical protein